MTEPAQSTIIHMAADTKGQINLRIPPEVFGDLLSGNRTAVLFKGKPHRGFKIRPYRMPTNSIKRTFDGWVIPIKQTFTDGAYKVSLPVDLIQLDSRLPKLPLTAYVTEHGIDTDALPPYVQAMVTIEGDDVPAGDLIDDRAEEAAVASGETDQPQSATEQVAKRGPGRPKKTADAGAVVKRGPGRPRKQTAAAEATTSEQIEQPKKRGPGRPRKNPLPEQQVQVASQVEDLPEALEAGAEQPKKRGPGRPRKNTLMTVEAGAEQPKKRGPGRPRKNPLPEQQVQADVIATSGPVVGETPATQSAVEQPKKRGPGRPRKNPVLETQADTPVLATAVVGEQPAKRGPGRPRKIEISQAAVVSSSDGAPALAAIPEQQKPEGTPLVDHAGRMLTLEVKTAARVIINAVLEEVKSMVAEAVPVSRTAPAIKDEKQDVAVQDPEMLIRAVAEARRHGVSRMALRGFLLSRPDQMPGDNFEAWSSRFFDKRAVLNIQDVAEMAGVTVAEVESRMETKPNTTPAPVVRGDGMLRWFPDEVHAWLGSALDVDAELAKTPSPRNIHAGFLLLPEAALLLDMPDWMLKEIIADHAERLPQTWALIDGEWIKHGLQDVADISDLAMISGDLQKWMKARQAA